MPQEVNTVTFTNYLLKNSLSKKQINDILTKDSNYSCFPHTED